jgi:hypothetical protein
MLCCHYLGGIGWIWGPVPCLDSACAHPYRVASQLQSGAGRERRHKSCMHHGGVTQTVNPSSLSRRPTPPTLCTPRPHAWPCQTQDGGAPVCYADDDLKQRPAVLERSVGLSPASARSWRRCGTPDEWWPVCVCVEGVRVRVLGLRVLCVRIACACACVRARKAPKCRSIHACRRSRTESGLSALLCSNKRHSNRQLIAKPQTAKTPQNATQTLNLNPLRLQT